MSATSAPAPAGELLYGAKAIARYLGITERQVWHLKEKGALPCWKEGKSIIARRSTVHAWIVQREAAGCRAMPGSHDAG